MYVNHHKECSYYGMLAITIIVIEMSHDLGSLAFATCALKPYCECTGCWMPSSQKHVAFHYSNGQGFLVIAVILFYIHMPKLTELSFFYLFLFYVAHS